MKKIKNGYISGLDGLRALAVMMVVGYHLKISQFKGGVLGVTLFFVISGFLITRLLLQELYNTNTIDLKRFWVKRIKRIWPALLTMISLTIVISAICNRVLFTKACQDFVSAIFGFNNWYQIFNNISYFDNGGAPSPLLHCWSLAIETQFYLIFPIIILMISKINKNNLKRHRLLMVVTAVLMIMSSFLMCFLFDPTSDPSRVYYGLDTRAFSLLMGALLAIIMQYHIKFNLKRVFNDMIGVISLIMICVISATVAGYETILYRGGYVFVSFLTVLVILSMLRDDSLLAKILSFSIIDKIGKLSYSIYLWHYPVIILISGGKKSSVFIMIIEIALTMILSILSYYLIETPIRHGMISQLIKSIQLQTIRDNKSLKKDVGVLSLSCLLFVSSILCVMLVPKENMSKSIQQLSIQTDKTKKAINNTDKVQKSDDEIASGLDVFIIGDSVAEGAKDQLQAAFPNARINVRVSRHCSESVPVLQSEINDAKWDGDCLIFSLGTNGPMYDFMEKTRAILKSDKPMFILTIRAPYEEWSEDNNIQIKEFCQNNDNVYLIDWASYSEGHSDWFVRDETHLTTAGTIGFTNCIKEKVVEVFKQKK